MQKLNFRIVFSSVSILLLFSCVPLKSFKEMEQKHQDVLTENRDLKKENQSLSVYKKELTAKNERLSELNAELAKDSLRLAKSLFNLKQELARSGKTNQELINQISNTSVGDAKEIKDLLAQLQLFQNDLQAREDALSSAEGALLDKRAELEKAIAELQTAQKDIEARNSAIEERNQRILEMEKMLKEKDDLMSALQTRVEEALNGFQGNGLEVHMKDGKLYVSLDEKLLFQSGKWAVDARGVSAITKLSEVLVENPDVQVMIEGHTDNVPFNGGSAISDNWDLSVKRATSIVKILLQNKAIEPKRVIASGRGEFVPVDPANTPAARQKNRRTEIILTPDLDKVMKVLSGEK